jgi:hypothetical protein
VPLKRLLKLDSARSSVGEDLWKITDHFNGGCRTVIYSNNTDVLISSICSMVRLDKSFECHQSRDDLALQRPFDQPWTRPWVGQMTN